MNILCLFGHKYVQTHEGQTTVHNVKYNIEQHALVKIECCVRCKNTVGFFLTEDNKYPKNPDWLIGMNLVVPVKIKPPLTLLKE